MARYLRSFFSPRSQKNDFYFLNYYYPYLETVDKTEFYNTRRQFTKISYFNGGANSTKEENLKVFHTQNINRNLNFGLSFNTLASQGQYVAQKARRNSFKAFASFESKPLKSFLNVNTNNFTTNENGGILNDH
ncbi:MAG: putative porin [Bacteroidales bacterium]|nr:putative porin [Bacteroidales bacterium]